MQGRFFTDFEDQHREDVAVIGDEIDKNFFPRTMPSAKPFWWMAFLIRSSAC